MERSERARHDGLRPRQHLFGGSLQLLFHWITTELMWTVWFTPSGKKLTLARVWGSAHHPQASIYKHMDTLVNAWKWCLGLKKTMHTPQNFAHIRESVNDSGLLPQRGPLWTCLWQKCHVYVSEQISFSAFSAQAQLCSCSGGEMSIWFSGLGPTAVTEQVVGFNASPSHSRHQPPHLLNKRIGLKCFKDISQFSLSLISWSK